MTYFTRPITLTRNIVILDGLTGTGKTMFSPLLATFDRMQNPRFEYMVEYLAISSTFGKINNDAANTLLNLLIDQKYYDGMISREVNFRPTDLSSVFLNGNGYRYLKRLLSKDGVNVEQRITTENPVFLLVTHQLISCLDKLSAAFDGRLKVVEIVRHPLYLIDHWCSYIDMHGANARDLTIWIEYKGYSLPWFAAGWEQKYLDSNQHEKVIYSIDRLMAHVFEKVSDTSINDNIFFIPFEQFVLSPIEYIQKLELFLNLKTDKGINRYLKKQKVPRTRVNDGPSKQIYKRYGVERLVSNSTNRDDYNNTLKRHLGICSTDCRATLEKLISDYEQIFGRWF